MYLYMHICAKQEGDKRITLRHLRKVSSEDGIWIDMALSCVKWETLI